MVNSNPLDHNSENPMNWKDAAVVSLILTLATYFTVFLPTWTILKIELATLEFVYATIQFVGASFFTQFIALAGLHAVTKKPKPEQKQ